MFGEHTVAIATEVGNSFVTHLRDLTHFTRHGGYADFIAGVVPAL